MNRLAIILFELSAIISIVLFFQKDSKTIRIFFPFLVLRAASEIYSKYLSDHKHNNTWLGNLTVIFSICFYLYTLSLFINNGKVKKISIFLSLFILLSFTISCFFFLPITHIHIYEVCIGSLMVVCVGIYYFYELLHIPGEINLLTYPPFWIVTGVLFNFAGEMPVFLFINFIAQQKFISIENIFLMIHFLDIVLNTLLIIAFLCKLKLRKPSLSY